MSSAAILFGAFRVNYTLLNIMLPNLTVLLNARHPSNNPLGKLVALDTFRWKKKKKLGRVSEQVNWSKTSQQNRL